MKTKFPFETERPHAFDTDFQHETAVHKAYDKGVRDGIIIGVILGIIISGLVFGTMLCTSING